MDNPGTLPALGTQPTGQRQTQHRKLKCYATQTPQKPGVNQELERSTQFLFLLNSHCTVIIHWQ
jgi:hypothetical protein